MKVKAYWIDAVYQSRGHCVIINIMLMKTKILDCTLRDGGYYTNWDFSSDVVMTYIETTNKLPVELHGSWLS